MKIFSENFKNGRTIMCGERVQFVNGVAEVTEELGVAILSAKYQGIYEFGKQPAHQTAKEVQLKSDFALREEWYQNELARYRTMVDAKNEKIKLLEAEIKTWKNNFEAEHKLRLDIAQGIAQATQEDIAVIPESYVEENEIVDDEVVREGDSETPVVEGQEESEVAEGDLKTELEMLTKAELIKFGTENGIDMAEVESAKKSEIIEHLLAASK